MEPMTAAAILVLSISVAFLCGHFTKRIPTRLRTDQAPKSKFGAVLVDGFGSRLRVDGIDILFVHGLGSNPDTTWRGRKPTSNTELTNGDGYSCWVSDFLPEDIPPEIREDTRAFFYNHDTFWKRDAVPTRLWTLGHNLLNIINTEIQGTEVERSRGLIFVGHSYGGLIIKQALTEASINGSFADISKRTKGIFFLGTPHRGSSFSKWGEAFARTLQPLGSNPSILGELTYDSVSLLDLHRGFVAATANNPRVVNFFEERRTLILKIWVFQWEQFCVREQSATYEGSNVENVGLSVDHFGLNKFGSRNPVYGTILSHLLKMIIPLASQRQHHLYAVPLETVSSYTERHELQSAIKEKLHKYHENNSVPHALVMYGLGGTGKTQLALRYVEDHTNDYNPILWIDAKDRETARSSFERCARELRLSVDTALTQGSALTESATVQAVLRWLRDRNELDDEWLVVVDNADDVSWGINKILPIGKRGNVIVTSQDNQSPRLFNGGCEKLQIIIMETFEARALLLQRLDRDFESSPQDIQVICDEIVQRLGYLALAIDLAGAYISNDPDQEAGLRQYLADYSKHQDELLKSNYFRGLSISDKTVWSVWDTTLDKIETEYPEARPGFAFLAHFNGGIIQEELFRLASFGSTILNKKLGLKDNGLPSWLKQLVKLDGQTWDHFYYRKLLEPLIRYSLVQRVNGEWPGVTMHGLVRWRAMKYEENQAWRLWYLKFVLAACNRICKEKANPQFRRHIATHITDVKKSYLEDLGVDEESLIFVWITISKVYYSEGRWDEAEGLQVQVMETTMTKLGVDHPATISSMANLASTYRNQGRWDEAEGLEVQVMDTMKTKLGVDHLDTLTSMAYLASTCWNQGRWDEAEGLFIQVMETRRTKLGVDHLDTLTSMANLASTYRNQGRWDEAEGLFIQVMETRRTKLGVDHPATLTSLANLALTYQNQGRWDEAEGLLIQVMEKMKMKLGVDHPATLSSMANLASTYRNQGRWDEAEGLEVQVMATRKTKLRVDHPDTLTSMANLASTYRNQGRLNEAEGLEVQVMETRRMKLGVDHPDTLTSMANLASTYWNQGRWDEAEGLFIQVMETRRMKLGVDHPATLTSMANLASTYRNQGRWDEAEGLEIQVMETRKIKLGVDHPDTLTSMNNLAQTWKDQNRDLEALDLSSSCLELTMRKLGANHPDTLKYSQINNALIRGQPLY